jgi:pimeloyl-ACP methyl ester carboxylesterase
MSATGDVMTRGRFRHQGYTLGYEVHGNGERVIVLTHGLLLDAGVNRQLARSLAAHGFRVVLLDLLGHGTSDKPDHARPASPSGSTCASS